MIAVRVATINLTSFGNDETRVLGATVFFGVTISVFLTLYLIPAMYVLLARKTRSPEYLSRLVEKLKREIGRAHV